MRAPVTSAVHLPSRRAGPQDFAAFVFPDNEHREEFAPAMTYPAGVELFREADVPKEVLYLEHGLVKLQKLHVGGEEIIIGLRSAGWFLAAVSVLLERPCAATGITVTACRVARMSAATFRQRVKAGGALSWSVHRMTCEEVQAQLGLVTDLSTVPARERLEQFLWSLAAGLRPSSEGDVRFEVPLRQWEIAQLIGVTPPYLSQLLGELGEAGVLSRDGPAIVLRKSPPAPRGNT
jgi:CRP-like cAMP-binding protein